MLLFGDGGGQLDDPAQSVASFGGVAQAKPMIDRVRVGTNFSLEIE